ncbi:MAG: GerMN domain-containing protein [Thermotogae bacterium]|nr:GerMN domain-containing protein [Thermotogota bacterium]
MRAGAVILLLMLSVTAVSALKITVFYVDGNMQPHPTQVIVSAEENPVVVLFTYLQSPPSRYLSLMPKDSVNAVYIVYDTIYVDLKKEKFKYWRFEDARLFVHSLVCSIFQSFEGIHWVKLLLDGEDGVLGGWIETTYKFGREVWQYWPVEKTR